VHDGRILGEGYHAAAGGPHAEVHAIAAAQARLGRDIGRAADGDIGKDVPILQDSTLYVSLEPCCHENKRTPPCTRLILAHGIPRVVVGCLDPNPAVAGNGVALLRQHGVAVEVAAEIGIDSAPFEDINRVFFTNQRLHRPYIVLKWAETADGYLAALDGGSSVPIAITGADAAAYTHRLRALHHAIAVGRRTEKIDLPRLTVRKYYGENPTKLVLSRQAFDIEALLASSWASVMVEGGQEILNTFIESDLWDEIHVLRNPDYWLGHGLSAPAIPLNQGYSSHKLGKDELRVVRRARFRQAG